MTGDVERLTKQLEDPTLEILVLMEILRISKSPVVQAFPVTANILIACKSLEIMLKHSPTDELAEMVRTRILETAATQREV